MRPPASRCLAQGLIAHGLLMATFWLLALARPALAQEAQEVPPAQAHASAQALQQIEARREREMAAFDAEDAQCFQRIAVSGCQKDVQSRRRALLADLRRQQALLHEQEAAQRGAEQRQRSAQKALDKAQQAQDLAREDPGAQAGQKQQAQLEKQAAHAAQAQASAPVRNEAAKSAGPDAAERAENRASYARKQAAADQKRQELARRLAKPQDKPVQALPLPP